MLVLSRKQNERIFIGDGIEITVVEIRGDRVKLGFNCPPDVPIHREEIYRQIRENGGDPRHARSHAAST